MTSARHRYSSYKISRTLFEVDERYTNLKLIGQGSYGTVCSAYDTKMNFPVAIKKIPNVFKVLADAKRALREVRLMLHLAGHENVIELLDMYLMPPNTLEFTDLYLVMERWPCDLDKIISSRQALSNQHLQLFLYQIIRGTRYLHTAGVLHRDLVHCLLLSFALDAVFT